jgi:hypothetical protein
VCHACAIFATLPRRVDLANAPWVDVDADGHDADDGWSHRRRLDGSSRSARLDSLNRRCARPVLERRRRRCSNLQISTPRVPGCLTAGEACGHAPSQRLRRPRLRDQHRRCRTRPPPHPRSRDPTPATRGADRADPVLASPLPPPKRPRGVHLTAQRKGLNTDWEQSASDRAPRPARRTHPRMPTSRRLTQIRIKKVWQAWGWPRTARRNLKRTSTARSSPTTLPRPRTW